MADQMTDPAEVSGAARPSPPFPAPHAGRARWWPPLAALACAAVLTLAAYAGSVPLGGAVLLLSALLVGGWPVLLDLPAPRSTVTALAICAILSDVAVTATRTDPLLSWLSLAAAGGVVVSFGHQLLRRDGRPRLVESLSGEVMAVALLACGAALIALPRTQAGADAVLALCVAVAATAVVELMPLPERLLALPAIVAAAAAGGVAAGLAHHTPTDFGVTTGLAYGIAAVVLRRIFMTRPMLAFTPAAVALSATPIAACGIVTYVLARLFVG